MHTRGHKINFTIFVSFTQLNAERFHNYDKKTRKKASTKYKTIDNTVSGLFAHSLMYKCVKLLLRISGPRTFFCFVFNAVVNSSSAYPPPPNLGISGTFFYKVCSKGLALVLPPPPPGHLTASWFWDWVLSGPLELTTSKGEKKN